MKTQIRIIFMLLVFISSCTKDEETLLYNVNPEFETFVSLFVDEGKERGFSYNLNEQDISINFTKLDYGCASVLTQNPIDIVIDKDYWQSFSLAEKEELIFIMLGRTVLKREEVKDTLPNGDPKSIMRKKGLGLWIDQNYYKREYYIDELFSPLAPIPEWSNTDDEPNWDHDPVDNPVDEIIDEPDSWEHNPGTTPVDEG